MSILTSLSKPTLIAPFALVLALASLFFSPLFEDRISLTADFTAAWAPGLYANASGRVELSGHRSAWDKLRAPLEALTAASALRSALTSALADAGPDIRSGALAQKSWAHAALGRCSRSLEGALGGRWSARSDDLSARPTANPPLSTSGLSNPPMIQNSSPHPLIDVPPS